MIGMIQDELSVITRVFTGKEGVRRVRDVTTEVERSEGCEQGTSSQGMQAASRHWTWPENSLTFRRS